MSVIGNKPVSNFQRIAKQTITGTGATAYSLDRSISSAADLAVFVNNVRQEPDVAYTASTTTITFSEAINNTDTAYVLYIGQSVGTVGHPADQPLTASTGTFSGALSGTTGAFSGAVSGTTGTFTGGITAPGSVIQVVQNTEKASQTSTNSTSFVDANLNCSITPSSTSSKILVHVTFQQKTSSSGDYGLFGLKRDSTDLEGGSHFGTQQNDDWETVSFQYLDSPSTSSSVTYTLRYRSYAGSNYVYIGWASSPGSVQVMTLMEIAQ